MRHFKVNQDILSNKDLVWSILFLFILIGGIFLEKSCNQRALKDFVLTRGVITEKSGGTFRKFPALVVRYEINGNKINSYLIDQVDCFEKYQIGDSVEIKYSKDKPKVVEILNCDE
jgi:hypothetical protein